MLNKRKQEYLIMPVFDFSNDTSEIKEEVVCTYTTFSSNADHATIECPILILSNKKKQWEHHSCGVFSDQNKQTAFEFEGEDGTVISDILKLDSRFVSLVRWLGENHIHVRLSGENTVEGYCVYKIREIALGGGNSSRGSYKAFSRRRIPSVYDRTFIPK